MFKKLEEYQVKGRFDFKSSSNLYEECTAPRNSSGIYLIYADVVNVERLIYVGVSGREGSNGEIIHRQDGLGGHIVNNKQFGKNRSISWPIRMKEDSIKCLIIKWYVTSGARDNDLPKPIEKELLEKFESDYGRLPFWNTEK